MLKLLPEANRTYASLWNNIEPGSQHFKAPSGHREISKIIRLLVFDIGVPQGSPLLVLNITHTHSPFVIQGSLGDIDSSHKLKHQSPYAHFFRR
jgi:hypothetical protein